jgi:hypothetical protein
VQSVGEKVRSVGAKVQSVGEKVQSVGAKVQSVRAKVQSVGNGSLQISVSRCSYPGQLFNILETFLIFFGFGT